VKVEGLRPQLVYATWKADVLQAAGAWDYNITETWIVEEGSIMHPEGCPIL